MTLNMTAYNFGDVVFVPFPFTDQTTVKKRPAVVISSAVYNRERLDVIIMAVTSRFHHLGDKTGEVVIDSWQETGLIKLSLVKPIITTRRIIRKARCFAESSIVRQSLSICSRFCEALIVIFCNSLKA